eukprot:12928949-Prorocentrum_lima.AAC.1
MADFMLIRNKELVCDHSVDAPGKQHARGAQKASSAASKCNEEAEKGKGAHRQRDGCYAGVVRG